MSSERQDLLAQARLELAALEGRVEALRALLERAVRMEDGLREPALTVTDPQARAAEQARSIASHMALSGYPRWKTEDQLRGTVDQRALGQMLDEVYGAQSQVG